MSEIVSIVRFDGYIEVVHEGVVERGFPNMKNTFEQTLTACNEHQCKKVLDNYAEVDYTIDSDIFSEHRLAEYLTRPEFAAIKWAFVLPEAFERSKIHLENAAYNRGVRLQTFLDRDKAIHWLIND